MALGDNQEVETLGSESPTFFQNLCRNFTHTLGDEIERLEEMIQLQVERVDRLEATGETHSQSLSSLNEKWELQAEGQNGQDLRRDLSYTLGNEIERLEATMHRQGERIDRLVSTGKTHSQSLSDLSAKWELQAEEQHGLSSRLDSLKQTTKEKSKNLATLVASLPGVKSTMQEGMERLESKVNAILQNQQKQGELLKHDIKGEMHQLRADLVELHTACSLKFEALEEKLHATDWRVLEEAVMSVISMNAPHISSMLLTRNPTSPALTELASVSASKVDLQQEIMRTRRVHDAEEDATFEDENTGNARQEHSLSFSSVGSLGAIVMAPPATNGMDMARPLLQTVDSCTTRQGDVLELHTQLAGVVEPENASLEEARGRQWDDPSESESINVWTRTSELTKSQWKHIIFLLLAISCAILAVWVAGNQADMLSNHRMNRYRRMQRRQGLGQGHP